MAKIWIFLGALFGFLSVAFGAFGAHGLSRQLDERSLTVFQTGVQYQMFHSLALVALGVWSATDPGISHTVPGSAFTAGILLFSGSLYILALTELKFFGLVTPIGGLLFLAGWAALAVAALRS
ncbi:MAG: DUF423 domain-containing protein [bacterium]|nr:DUF423 domain-containing protein [bacterium]